MSVITRIHKSVQMHECYLSSNLTTFTTPYGRYKWLRLPFGTSVSAEIFAKRLYDCVHDLSGIVCIADDLMIYGVGRTDDEATRDHDLKLEKLLQRCREVGIRLNASKMSQAEVCDISGPCHNPRRSTTRPC